MSDPSCCHAGGSAVAFHLKTRTWPASEVGSEAEPSFKGAAAATTDPSLEIETAEPKRSPSSMGAPSMSVPICCHSAADEFHSYTTTWPTSSKSEVCAAGAPTAIRVPSPLKETALPKALPVEESKSIPICVHVLSARSYTRA